MFHDVTSRAYTQSTPEGVREWEDGVPHLELNAAGWIRLAEDCHIHSIDDLAEMLSLDPAELLAFMQGDDYPDTEFVATCLSSLPAAFNDLFVVKVTSGQLVA